MEISRVWLIGKQTVPDRNDQIKGYFCLWARFFKNKNWQNNSVWKIIGENYIHTYKTLHSNLRRKRNSEGTLHFYHVTTSIKKKHRKRIRRHQWSESYLLSENDHYWWCFFFFFFNVVVFVLLIYFKWYWWYFN
jgi:hypothetical protein